MHKTIRILTLLVAAMIVGAGEAWAETTDGVNYCGKSDVNDGKNLVWYVTEEGTDGVKTLHIDKNPAVTDANADFSMADYNNDDASVAAYAAYKAAGAGSGWDQTVNDRSLKSYIHNGRAVVVR